MDPSAVLPYRVLSEARESWEEKLQEQLATLTARLQHTARVIGAGHRQASVSASQNNLFWAVQAALSPLRA